MKAIDAMMAERDQFEIEAERYCRERAPSASPEAVRGLAASLREDAFIRETRPFTDLKVDVYRRTIPTIMVCEDSAQIETTWKFSESDQKILDDCDRHIEAIAKRYQSPQRRSGDSNA